MPVNLNAGVITFRHAVRKTKDGKYGYPISVKVRKFSIEEQAVVVGDLEKLQDQTPIKKPDWCGSKAWEIWAKELPLRSKPLDDPFTNEESDAFARAYIGVTTCEGQWIRERIAGSGMVLSSRTKHRWRLHTSFRFRTN